MFQLVAPSCKKSPPDHCQWTPPQGQSGSTQSRSILTDWHQAVRVWSLCFHQLYTKNNFHSVDILNISIHEHVQCSFGNAEPSWILSIYWLNCKNLGHFVCLTFKATISRRQIVQQNKTTNDNITWVDWPGWSFVAPLQKFQGPFRQRKVTCRTCRQESSGNSNEEWRSRDKSDLGIWYCWWIRLSPPGMCKICK